MKEFHWFLNWMMIPAVYVLFWGESLGSLRALRRLPVRGGIMLLLIIMTLCWTPTMCQSLCHMHAPEMSLLACHPYTRSGIICSTYSFCWMVKLGLTMGTANCTWSKTSPTTGEFYDPLERMRWANQVAFLGLWNKSSRGKLPVSCGELRQQVH